MVAGHEAHLVGGPERVEPGRGKREFGFEPDVENIPRHRNVIGLLCMNVGDDRRKHVHIVGQRPAPLPVHVTGNAFAEELAPVRVGKGTDMRVGKMGEKKAHDVSLPPGAGRVKLATPCSA